MVAQCVGELFRSVRDARASLPCATARGTCGSRPPRRTPRRSGTAPCGVGAHGEQVAGEQLFEFDCLLGGEILQALEQAPLRKRQYKEGLAEAVARAELAGFLGTLLVDRLVHL